MEAEEKELRDAEIAAQNAEFEATIGDQAAVRETWRTRSDLESEIKKTKAMIASLERSIADITARKQGTGKGSMLRASLKRQRDAYTTKLKALETALPSYTGGKKTRKLPKGAKGFMVRRICATMVIPVGTRKKGRTKE